MKRDKKSENFVSENDRYKEIIVIFVKTKPVRNTMIVYGMTEDELKLEVLKDMINVIRYKNINQNKFRRLVIKSSRFPVYSHFYYLSPRKNKWLVLLEARNKKETGPKARFVFVVIHNTPHGLYALHAPFIDDRLRLILHSPHFFVRFRQRTGSEKTGTELIKEYFKYNNEYMFDVVRKEIDDKTHFVELAGLTVSGVALGVATAKDNIIFRTFITYEMLNKDQIEKYMMTADTIKETNETLFQNRKWTP